MKKDQISFFSAISIVIGSVIGSGVFMKPARVIDAMGSTNGAIIAWVLGGAIALLGALTLAEISARIPRVGGIYTYAEEIYGKGFGFTSGWIISVIYAPALNGGIALYLASLTAQFFELADTVVVPLAVMALIILTIISCIRTSWGVFLQNTTTLGKFVPLIAITAGGLFLGNHEAFNITVPDPSGLAPAGLGVAMLATFWAYDGWSQVCSLGDEVKEPAKNLPKVFIYGVLIIMLVYVLINIAIVKAVPAAEIVSLNERAASVAAERLFGVWGGKLVSLGMIVAILGAVNANILTLPLVTYSMARNKLFPASKLLGKTSKTDTPANSIIFQTLLSIFMVLFLNVDSITDIAMFSMYVFNSCIFIGLFKLRRRDQGLKNKEIYRVPLYPFVPLLAIIGSLYVCYSMFANSPYDALGAIIVAALGFPIYKVLTKNQASL